MSECVFGPIREPKLGKVFVLNPFRSFVCNYSCRYCLLGSYPSSKAYYDHDLNTELLRQLKTGIRKYGLRGVKAFLISPYGEPTLYRDLPQLIKLLKPIGKPVALYSNSSMLMDDDVFNLLLSVDIVVFKLDTIYVDTFHKLNNPETDVDPMELIDRLVRFRKRFRGKLYLETMFVKGYNDNREEVNGIIEVVRRLNPNKFFISAPYYPNNSRVYPPSESITNYVYDILFAKYPNRVFRLTKYSLKLENIKSDNPIDDLINTANLYPVEYGDALEYLGRHGLDGEEVIKDLVDIGDVAIVKWLGVKYVVPRSLYRRYVDIKNELG